MMRVVNEVHQISARKDNIIIFGLPEKDTGSLLERASYDKEEVRSVAASLDVSDIAIGEVKRLGQPQAKKPRPLKVKCINPDDKQQLLKNARRLRQHQRFKNVYINHDFTRLQQECNRHLRNELKSRRENHEDVIIWNGRVVPRNRSEKQFF